MKNDFREVSKFTSGSDLDGNALCFISDKEVPGERKRLLTHLWSSK